MDETIFGWHVERLSPHKVRLTKDDMSLVMKGAPDMAGDVLVRAALDRVLAFPSDPRPDAHVVTVPTAELTSVSHPLE